MELSEMTADRHLDVDELRRVVLENRAIVVALLYEDAVKRLTEASLNRQAADGEVQRLDAHILVLRECLRRESERIKRLEGDIQKEETAHA